MIAQQPAFLIKNASGKSFHDSFSVLLLPVSPAFRTVPSPADSPCRFADWTVPNRMPDDGTVACLPLLPVTDRLNEHPQASILSSALFPAGQVHHLPSLVFCPLPPWQHTRLPTRFSVRLPDPCRANSSEAEAPTEQHPPNRLWQEKGFGSLDSAAWWLFRVSPLFLLEH